MTTKAPFETFFDHRLRDESGEPYNAVFLDACREAALRYAQEDKFLRDVLLSDLWRCIPLHFRGRVFDGISFVDVVARK
jgi:hypothetical protein